MRSQPTIVRLEPLDLIGSGRISDAQRRLKQWDGKSWAVTQLPVQTANKMHVLPATEECVDWLGFWIDTKTDTHVRVVN